MFYDHGWEGRGFKYRWLLPQVFSFNHTALTLSGITSSSLSSIYTTSSPIPISDASFYISDNFFQVTREVTVEISKPSAKFDMGELRSHLEEDGEYTTPEVGVDECD